MEKIRTITFVLPISLLSVPSLAVAFAQMNQPNITDTNSQQTTSALENADNNNFLTYENATLGISIQYPSGWMKVEENGTGVMFISPPDKNNSEASSVMVNVQIANLSLFSLSPSDLSLENYTNLTIEALTSANLIVADFNIIESNSTTLGIGNKDSTNTAHKLVFSMQEGEEGLTVQQMQIYTIRDSTLYSITYIAESGKYPIYFPTVQKIIDSFTIIDHQQKGGMFIDG